MATLALNHQRRLFDSDEEEFQTLENMDTFGGSFVKGLANLYRLADFNNKTQLRWNFWSYFKEYLPAKWKKEK